MAVTVTHGFSSGIADDPAAALAGKVLPSHWNADHTISGGSNDDILQRKAGAWTNRTLAQLMTDLAALGTTFQPLDNELTALASVTAAADKLPYFTGASTASTTDFTAFARTLLDDANQSAMQTTLGLVPGSTVQAFDSDLTALAVSSTTGLYTRTGSGSSATRTITAPAAGITVSNGDGVSGNPTLALANDLSALEGMSGTGLVARTASETYAQRTLTAPAAGITVSNGDGVSGNPTLALANDLAALEALSTTGIVARTASETYVPRTITGSGLATLTNGDGVSAAPNIDVDAVQVVLHAQVFC